MSNLIFKYLIMRKINLKLIKNLLLKITFKFYD